MKIRDNYLWQIQTFQIQRNPHIAEYHGSRYRGNACSRTGADSEKGCASEFSLVQKMGQPFSLVGDDVTGIG